jgi:hypothetical protein
MLRQLVSIAVLLALIWANWMAWQPPTVSTRSQPVLKVLPERPGDTSELWRVVTRRMIVPKAAEDMRNSLLALGLPAISLQHQDEVELYAFDDSRSFASREDAARARDAWKKAGFEAEIFKPDEHFGISLGRLYLEAYAQQLQRRLENAKRPYVYHRHQVTIPTWRFTFPAAPYAEAKGMWMRVQAMGMADPVLMQESRFQALFGDVQGGEPGN